MINRREFLRSSGALALGSVVLANEATALPKYFAGKKATGVQLYTVMSKIDADLDGTLKTIADIGYREIESAFSFKGGFYGMTAKEFAAKTKSLGLQWVSHHTVGAPIKLPANAKMPVGADGKPITLPPMKNLRENYQEIVDSVAEGGVKYLVCATTPIESMDEIKKSIEVLGKTGEACKKAGVTLAYHNHWKEFEAVEGQKPFDMLAAQLSPDILKFELDLGWATKAGADPVELFSKHPGRFPLWHVKDIDKTTQLPVEIGAGYIDFKRIFAAADVSGMKHFFVEQDAAPKPLENLATSFANLQKVID